MEYLSRAFMNLSPCGSLPPLRPDVDACAAPLVMAPDHMDLAFALLFFCVALLLLLLAVDGDILLDAAVLACFLLVKAKLLLFDQANKAVASFWSAVVPKTHFLTIRLLLIVNHCFL